MQNFYFYAINIIHTLWQYGLWSFQTGGTKLERFLPKNQHTKGQLISKCLYEIIVWTKIPTKNFDNFCPERARAETKNFRWYFGPNDDFIKTF